jgi:hypothetical protein
MANDQDQEIYNPMPVKEELERAYSAGNLNNIKSQLEEFLKEHKQDILVSVSGKYQSLSTAEFELTLETVIGLYIIQHKSINARAEIIEQKQEIEKEKWIRHQKDSSESSEEIALDWIRKYAGPWRTHRIRTILFVYEKDKHHYLSILENS